MAAGKTNQPLKILVTSEELYRADEVRELMHKGHIVQNSPFTSSDFDLIVGPNCWQMRPELLKYLDIALKAARRLKNASKPDSKPKQLKKKVRRAKKAAPGDSSGTIESGVPAGALGWTGEPSGNQPEQSSN